ncbi:hypothetical protein [Candidatus Nitrospira bockiana]
MTIKGLGLIFGTIGLLLSTAGCQSDGITDAEAVPAYGSRDPFGPGIYRRAPGPWDLQQNQRQIGPSTWYGCPQQASRCYPE